MKVDKRHTDTHKKHHQHHTAAAHTKHRKYFACAKQTEKKTIYSTHSLFHLCLALAVSRYIRWHMNRVEWRQIQDTVGDYSNKKRTRDHRWMNARQAKNGPTKRKKEKPKKTKLASLEKISMRRSRNMNWKTSCLFCATFFFSFFLLSMHLHST